MAWRSITAATSELVRRLHATGSRPPGWLRSGDNRSALLRAIGDSGEPAAVCSTLSYVFDDSAEVRTAAIDASLHLFACSSDETLPRLDEMIRSCFAWRADGTRWVLVPSDVERLATIPDPTVLLGLAASHSSGYVRQASVECLDRLPGGGVLPFLLLRLNDWVEPVRNAAWKAAERRLTPDLASAWVQHLGLALQLAGCRRSFHWDFLQKLLTLLGEPACRNAVHQGLERGSRTVRQACFELLLDSPGDEPKAVIEQMLFDRDPIIRSDAAAKMGKILEADRLHGLLPRLGQDSWMPVRRAALEALAERWPEEAEPALRRALMDPAAGVRQTARFYLKRPGEVYADVYRQGLASASAGTVAVAIRGLGEVGSRADAGRIVPFLGHPAPRVRRAAVRTLGTLQDGGYAAELLKALSDPRPSVSRAALTALRRRGPGLEPADVWAIFSTSPFLHVRQNVTVLMGYLRRWMAIPLLVRAARDAEAEVAEVGLRGIRQWLSRLTVGYARPDRDDLARLEAALNGPGEPLAAGIDQELRAAAAAWAL